jgi:peptidoglycan/LPS O-acetylase OafA/YrhL
MGWLAESGASVTPTHYRVIVFGSSGALLILGLVRWEAEFGSPFPSAINAIGDTSFSLYLSHVFVISSFAMAWSAAGLFQNEYGHAAYIAFAVVLSILVGIVSHRLIERPLLRLSRRVLRADDRGAPTSPVPNLVTPLR